MVIEIKKFLWMHFYLLPFMVLELLKNGELRPLPYFFNFKSETGRVEF